MFLSQEVQMERPRNVIALKAPKLCGGTFWNMAGYQLQN